MLGSGNWDNGMHTCSENDREGLDEKVPVAALPVDGVEAEDLVVNQDFAWAGRGDWALLHHQRTGGRVLDSSEVGLGRHYGLG